MKKSYILILLILCISFNASGQTYVLNEDFDGTTGTTPPAGWLVDVISGSVDDSWHFDNPGEKTINFPITDPFAIFDSEFTSANGQPEEVALQTPAFDASFSNYILLEFDHAFDPATGGTGIIEAYNGDEWIKITSFTLATANPATEIVDLSSSIGGITNARLRFLWTGNGSGYWAVDNIRIFASLPLDGGVLSIDSPTSPVAPGIQDVEITLGNFGYNTITTTTINWTVNGEAQPQQQWNGSISFGQTQGNVIIGSYDFQQPSLVKVWQSNPNGQADPNPFNDTISEYIESALCGTYTIGGADPDFETFADAAAVLNAAGIECAVTFLVRDGTYQEQFILENIEGTSAENTVTFRSESGNNKAAVLRIDPTAPKYEPMVHLVGASHIIFRELGLFTGSLASFANYAILTEGASNVLIEDCYLEVINRFDYGIGIINGSSDIAVRNCEVNCTNPRAGALSLAGNNINDIDISGNYIKGATEWGYTTIRLEGFGNRIEVTGNRIEQCYQPLYMTWTDSTIISGNIINDADHGIFVDNNCSFVEISGNRLTNIKSNQNAPDGTRGIAVVKSEAVRIFNNFIHTHGAGPINAIHLQETSSAEIHYNSINVTNTDQGQGANGLALFSSSAILGRNNTLATSGHGSPVVLGNSVQQTDLDMNNYHSPDGMVGIYEGAAYTSLDAWSATVNMDYNSISANPFYTSDTILSINQAQLNNAGEPVAGITTDIDGTVRNATQPDIGAKEYNPCSNDAGINEISGPVNPLNSGPEEVRVVLQNQGTAPLTSVQVNWKVNEEIQNPFAWSGNLAAGASVEATIGSYNFEEGALYVIGAWTSEPNNTVDCNNYNDTAYSLPLAAPLCGEYTIGGSSPDFTSVSEAASVLNIGGITCPVVFSIRNGIYYESFTLRQIDGTSATNTVTFRSESGDSTLAILQIDPLALKFQAMARLEGASHIFFENLGLFTGTEESSDNNALSVHGAEYIGISGCYIQSVNQYDFGVAISGGSRNINIENCRFESVSPRAGAIRVSDEPSREITITGSVISGSTQWGFNTVEILEGVAVINFSNNTISGCHRAFYTVRCDSMLIGGNLIDGCDYGIFIDDGCNVIEVSANRIVNIRSNQNAPDGTIALQARNSTGMEIFNNFIHTSGNGPGTGIQVANIASGNIHFNSVNIQNKDTQGRSRGIFLSGTMTGNARNNIFNIGRIGVPIQIEGNGMQVGFDRNDYMSSDGTVGVLNDTRYTGITEWVDATGMDASSLAVEPFFTSETDLSINQALLNNVAEPVDGITHDIDGASRNSVSPDIGAKEYAPCQNDAGINAILNPLPPVSGGIEEIVVWLQNQGSSTLTSAIVNWTVNGQTQEQYDWQGSLQPGDYDAITIGSADFQAGKLYTLKIWTSQPNGTPDCNPYNDTVTGPQLAAPLCGTYTIGGQDADFNSLTEAAEVLNSAGITCEVTFLVRDGEYFEKFILEVIPGSSENNRVVFRSESNDSSKVQIRMEPGALKFEPMIYLKGTANVAFESMGLITTSEEGESNYAIVMEAASDIRVIGCQIEAGNESDIGIIARSGSRDLVINNNRFDCPNSQAGALIIRDQNTGDVDISGNIMMGAENWGYTMIRISDYASHVNLESNTISNCYRAVYLLRADSVHIHRNTIRNANEGIYAEMDCAGLRITENRVFNIYGIQSAPDGTNGIRVHQISKSSIINNFVNTAGTFPVKGITVSGADTCRVYFNSVNSTNTDPLGRSHGLNITGSSNILTRNNILNITGTGKPIYIDQDVEEFSLDYNNYYSPGGIIGVFNGQTFTNLFTWGQTIGGDANSLSINSFFEADTVPLPYQRAINGAGIPIDGVEYDIDGIFRNTQAPDMGCVEFVVDIGVLELLNPTLECAHPAEDSVTVYLHLFGHVPFKDLKIAWQLDGGQIYYDTLPGPIYSSIIHTFEEKVDISAEGEYYFKIWLINTLDDNINNDTLNAMRYSKPLPEPSFEYDNFCTGPEVSFFGDASVAAPYFIESYEWLFGDGGTSTGQDPVHTYQEPGYYEVTLRAYSDAGCYGHYTETIFIDPAFQPLTCNYTAAPEVCLGDYSGSIEMELYGGYPPYQLFVNGQPVAEGVLPNLTSGTYVIRAEDSENCIFEDTVRLVPETLLEPQILAEPWSGFTPLTVEFSFTANDPESWMWHFSDNGTDTARMPSHTFTSFGNHEVILEVNSGPPNYCVERDTVIIFVDIIVEIEANNVFTPNGDGYNDHFEVKTRGVEEIDVVIFTRWGNKVYGISELDGKWDGRTEGGAEAPDGTYFFNIEALGYNGETYTRKGSVLLLRNASEAYPNPVENDVTVKIFDQLTGPLTGEVYSVFGQRVHSEAIPDPGKITLDLGHLRRGIYILKISDGERNYYNRIIKY